MVLYASAEEDANEANDEPKGLAYIRQIGGEEEEGVPPQSGGVEKGAWEEHGGGFKLCKRGAGRKNGL